MVQLTPWALKCPIGIELVGFGNIVMVQLTPWTLKCPNGIELVGFGNIVMVQLTPWTLKCPNGIELESLATLTADQSNLTANCNEINLKEDLRSISLAPAERETRIVDQRNRLTGLRLRGEEEVAHQCYDLVLNMVEKDALIYLGPEKFITRRAELQNRKPPAKSKATKGDHHWRQQLDSERQASNIDMFNFLGTWACECVPTSQLGIRSREARWLWQV